MSSHEFQGQEEILFQSLMRTLGLSASVLIGNARTVWTEAKKYAENAQFAPMEKVSILKEVNVRASASSEAVLPVGFGGNSAHAGFCKALSDAVLQASEADRAAFEGVFPPSVHLEFNEETHLYQAIDPEAKSLREITGNQDSVLKAAAELQNARWAGWNARDLFIAEKTRDVDHWKTLHGAMKLQRDHHRNVSNALRTIHRANTALLQEAAEATRANSDSVSLADRIDNAIRQDAREMLSSDALALKAIGAHVPSMTSSEAAKVKRFEFDRFGDVHEDEFGLYVKASDFDALVAQLIHQSEIPPVEAILYEGLRGTNLLQYPDEPAPTKLGGGRVRRTELRRSAFSFETLTSRLAAYESLLASADEIIRGCVSGERPAGASYDKIQKFHDDYQAAQKLADEE